MRICAPLRLAALACAAAGILLAQAPPHIQQLPDAPPPQQQPAQQASPVNPGAVTQTNPQGGPAGAGAAPRLTGSRGFLLGGVSLTEMIDVLAKMLKINYIL